ncbi:MAG: hypothetical protein B6D36_05610 [Planctomycetes bacterium UTPLA1]|nr:MAG: hypothetical protein B6D36_05610 [Planctomycetes bacterium UTPLA1]
MNDDTVRRPTLCEGTCRRRGRLVLNRQVRLVDRLPNTHEQVARATPKNQARRFIGSSFYVIGIPQDND